MTVMTLNLVEKQPAAMRRIIGNLFAFTISLTAVFGFPNKSANLST